MIRFLAIVGLLFVATVGAVIAWTALTSIGHTP